MPSQSVGVERSGGTSIVSLQWLLYYVICYLLAAVSLLEIDI